MKLKLPLFLLALLCHVVTLQAQISISNTNTNPHASAMLDVSSTDKGMLVPRMTSSERDAVQNPAQGLLVYDTDTGSFWYYEDSQWNQISADARAFVSENGVTRSLNNTDDFVFGADSLNHNSGSEYKFFFDKSQGAFRAGNVFDNNWDRDSLGFASLATGYDTKATGNYSVAMGAQTTASGFAATALGSETTANGYGSIAIGDQTTANGFGATALGIETTATGTGATALGNRTEATEIGAVALGSETTASETGATASGASTSATEYGATALGAETTASGFISTAIGYQTAATGHYSTTLGRSTSAPSYAELAVGMFNTTYTPNGATTIDSNDRLFVVGNGTANDNRSDALRIFKNGNAELNGALTINNAYTLPVVDGNSGQVLRTDGSGNISWANDGSDNLGNHTASQNIQLSDNWLSNDGGNEGLKINDDGDVRMGGDLIMGLNAIKLNDSNAGTAITFFDIAQDDFEIFMAQLLIVDEGIQLNGSRISNDGDSEGISIDNDGNVSTSGNLGVGGALSAQKSLTLFDGNQNVVLTGDAANNRVILDVGGSGASSDAFIIGDLTNSTNEVMMLGNVGIGTFSTPQKLTVGAQGDGTKAVANEWDTWSDRRLKKDFQEITNPIEKLNAINGYYYYWTEDKADQTKQVGVIAQEVETILPEIVTTNPDGYKSVDYTKLTALLIEVNQAQEKKLQEQQIEIDALQVQVAKIDQLETMLQHLQAQVTAPKATALSSNQK